MSESEQGPVRDGVDVLVVGGGASGVPAALQAARMGARVLIIEETPWLGGMLTSAGVSALDGNDGILSGIHREFVHALWKECGGPEGVRTGWVSHTLFEPKTGQAILRRLVDAEDSITLWIDTRVTEVLSDGTRVTGVRTEDGREVHASLVIDATECGDVIALSETAHRFGRESRGQTGEDTAPEKPDDLIQDLTWVLTLREHGQGDAHLVPRPPGFNPGIHEGSVRETTSDPDRFPFRVHPWAEMISYGRLPNDRFMLNWPHCGNDLFAPEYILQSHTERAVTTQRMKSHALGFLHYLQTACGHPEIGVDREAHPTPDGLPLIPYVREGRRIEATVTLHLGDVVDRHADPGRPLFMTGIAVGDYFIDHHHSSHLASAQPHDPCGDHRFPPIQALTVPLGCLIPHEVDGLIAAEKSIGVTHSVNGVTRLQPIVMNIGQAAGALAAVAVQRGLQPREVNPREVQQALLDAGALLMPFADVGPEHPAFQPIQRVAVSGVMRGRDEPRLCEFCPDVEVAEEDLQFALEALQHAGLGQEDLPRGLTREQLAVEIDRLADPFQRISLSHLSGLR
jgi:FAD dependent oxidoreductase